MICFSQFTYSQEENGVLALDLPVRNSLTFNRFLVNPTFSFVREQNKFINITNKRELLQIDDAPQTYVFGYSGRFAENVGAGISVFQETNGVLTTFGGILNLAYNVRFEEESNLTFGINIGAYKSGINGDKVVTNFNEPLLNTIPSNFLITVNPALNYGTGYIDFGVSLNNIVTYNFTTSALIEDNPEQGIQGHLMYTGYTGGYGFFGESKFTALGRAEFFKNANIYSASMMLTVPKGVWAQAGYNTTYGASAGLGINITSQIAIEYNYERAFSGLSNLGAAHEITLAYKFKNYNYYDYSRDDEVAGLFSLEKSTKKKKKKTTVAKAETEPVIENQNSDLKILKDETERIASEEKIVVKEEQAIKISEEEQKTEVEEENKIEIEQETRIAEEEKINTETEEAKKIAQEKQALTEAEEAKKIAEEERIKTEAEKAKRIAEERQAIIKAEQAAIIAEEGRKKEAAEEAIRIAKEEQARVEAEELAQLAAPASVEKPTDPVGESMNLLREQAAAATIKQTDLLNELQEAVTIKQNDLRDLKEENDLSEQGIFVTPKPFKSISAENQNIENIRIALDTIILEQSKKIDRIESLLKIRTKKVKDKNDPTNEYYRTTIAELKEVQQRSKRFRESMVSSLESISAATAFERKRRIKKAGYDNDKDRYQQDRIALNILRNSVSPNNKPLTTEDFDFGVERTNSIQILKNVQNTESAYYLVLATHDTKEARDSFLEKVIASGYNEIDFFYDVTTTRYYIYYKKFETIEEAKSTQTYLNGSPYADKASIVKIEN